MLGIRKVLSRNEGVVCRFQNEGKRWMVGKAANRAAVHGSKLPLPNAIPVKEVEMEIHRFIQEKESKRREIQNTVDSNLKNWPLLYFEQKLCSK